MKGKTWLFWGGLIATAGGILFQTSYEVQELEEKLAATNRKIVQEQESIQVLKAEWSFLNDPTRLEQLARAHLALQPVEARQFASLDIIPMRPAPPPEAAPAPSFPPTNGSGSAPMVRAPQPGAMPAVAGLSPAGRVPIPPASAGKFDKAGVVPVSAPAAAPLPAVQSTTRQQQPAAPKPATMMPATAKVLPVPAAPPVAPVSAPSAAPAGKLPANAPLPALNRPTDIAAAPIKSGSGLPAGVKPTDSLGLLVARLGANR